MIGYVGKAFHSAAVGRRLETVTCEKCGCFFHYELARMGSGNASAPYFLFQRNASGRATAEARRDLDKRLGLDAELVPCPTCHWVNQSLIDRYRKRKYRNAPIWIIAFMLGSLVIAPIVGAATTDRIALLTILALGLSSPAWGLLVRRQLRKRINPNQTFPLPPVVPIGTPPALIDRIDRKTGDRYIVPAAGAINESGTQSEWAFCRPGQLNFPRMCCVCLGPARTTYSSPFKVNERSDLGVPLCWECVGSLQRKWWLWALMTAALAVALAGCLAVAVPGIDQIGRWILFLTLGLFVVLFSVAIVPNRACRPYRIRTVDADRGITRFRARNPQYTQLLVEQIRQSQRGRKFVPRNA